MRVALCFSLAFALLACDNHSTTRSRAKIGVTPAALDFGNVPGGTSAKKTLTVLNSGTAPMNISSIEVNSDARHTFTLGALPTAVDPGSSAALDVTYASPTMPGADSAVLAILSDADNAPEFDVTVTAIAALSCASPLIACGGACLDPRADDVNCGACGQTCTGGKHCSAGACTCPNTCASLMKNCGMVPDACGGMLDCGNCTMPQTCGGGGVPNNCGCTAQSDAALCAAAALNCGTTTLTDTCGSTRSVSCGACTGSQTCTNNVCTCTPQSDTAFCTAQVKNCGSVTAADNCGVMRTVASCGSCSGPQTCGGGGTMNVCGCTPQSDSAFCTAQSKNCGSVTAADNCGVMRTVASCGTCTGPETCAGGGTMNVCGCTPQSDPAFCTAQGKNCGSVTAADNCGVMRTVASCGTCTGPQSCGGGGTMNVCGGGWVIGGTVLGLTGSGFVLSSSINGGAPELLPVAANGTFSFTQRAGASATYLVTVSTQPGGPAQVCSVSAGSGTANADVNTVVVSCPPQVLTPGLNAPSSLGVKGGNLYFGVGLPPAVPDCYSATGSGDGVMMMSTGGGAPAMIEALEHSGGNCGLYGVVFDSSFVYWTNYPTGNIRKSPLGAVSPSAVATVNGYNNALVWGGGDLFWHSYPQSSIGRVSTSGTGNTTFCSAPSINGQNLTTDGAFLYFTDSTAAGVYQVPFSASPLPASPTLIVNGETAASSPFVSGNTLYWISSGNVRFSSTVTPGAATLNSGPLVNPSALVADSSFVWVAALGPGGPNYLDGRIYKIPAAGGAPVIIAQGLKQPSSIATDGTYVYWTNYGTYSPRTTDGSIMKILK